MDLRVLVLIADHDLGELVRAQVENLGCPCSLVESYDLAHTSMGWADAAVVDLVGDGLDDLNRLRVEVPKLRVLAIAPDAAHAELARSAGAAAVVTEPFSISEIIEEVRALARPYAEVLDLTDASGGPAPAADEAPWWASR
jgi:DNA-binding response OmpR family regulator